MQPLDESMSPPRFAGFWHYHACFDAAEMISRHAHPEPTPRPGMVVNFLDVSADPALLAWALNERAGTVEPLPIPKNWHADMAEWAAALRAVDLSGDVFTMVELGCGWGCWMNNMGMAARRLGKSVQLIGIEADAGHIELARQALVRNGFEECEWDLHRGVAAGEPSSALFPIQPDGSGNWGLEPWFVSDPAVASEAIAGGGWTALPVLDLESFLAPQTRVDLLHVDIQGGEADLVEAGLNALTAKVAYIVVGTHSRQIEGRIMDTLLNAGWLLEMERPAFIDVGGPTPVIRVDGVQGWRNLSLSPLIVSEV